MPASPPLPSHRFPRVGGVDVVPHVLPIYVPEEAYDMTVAEWLDLKEGTQSRHA